MNQVEEPWNGADRNLVRLLEQVAAGLDVVVRFVAGTQLLSAARREQVRPISFLAAAVPDERIEFLVTEPDREEG